MLSYMATFLWNISCFFFNYFVLLFWLFKRQTIVEVETFSAQAQFDEKQRELDEVQAKFDAAMKEKQELLDDADSCRRKMTAATQLIEGKWIFHWKPREFQLE